MTKKEIIKKTRKILRILSLYLIFFQIFCRKLYSGLICATNQEKWWIYLIANPLKFFFLSPLNKISEKLQFNLAGELFFKSVVIKLILAWTSYDMPEQSFFFNSENYEKIKDPLVSIEKKQQILESSFPKLGHMAFNFLLAASSFFLLLNNDFLSQQNKQASHSSPPSFWWFFPYVVFLFLFDLSQKLAQQKKTAKKAEVKKWAKKWRSLFSMALFNFFLKPRLLAKISGQSYVNNETTYLFNFFNIIIDFFLNVVKLIIFFQIKSEKKLSV